MKDFLDALWQRIKAEPAVLISLLGAGFAMFATFGIELSKEQVGSITAFVVIVLGFLTRSQVTPTSRVAAEAVARDKNMAAEQVDPATPGHAQPELVAGPASDVIPGAPVEVVAVTDPRAYEDQS